MLNSFHSPQFCIVVTTILTIIMAGNVVTIRNISIVFVVPVCTSFIFFFPPILWQWRYMCLSQEKCYHSLLKVIVLALMKIKLKGREDTSTSVTKCWCSEFQVTKYHFDPLQSKMWKSTITITNILHSIMISQQTKVNYIVWRGEWIRWRLFGWHLDATQKVVLIWKGGEHKIKSR